MSACWAEVADAQRDREECAADDFNERVAGMLDDAADEVLLDFSFASDALLECTTGHARPLAKLVIRDELGEDIADDVTADECLHLILAHNTDIATQAMLALRQIVRRRLLQDTSQLSDPWRVLDTARRLVMQQDAADREMADLRRWEDA